MFKKFEAFMNKWLMPIAQKVDKQRHLSAIKAHLSAIKSSMVALTPFTILGSIFSILPALPNMIEKGGNALSWLSPVSNFITSNEELLSLPVTLSIGMLSIYVVMCIA